MAKTVALEKACLGALLCGPKMGGFQFELRKVDNILAIIFLLWDSSMTSLAD